ncbi:hypothetical protein [Streptomyces hesseae]|uniref:hypothetical protein n=1 Tax=Streptomyces hesseae TaxID=3075519 RepID=UPI00288AB8A3|nr:hypothetical protein [Streptomyces sp. DSM 40473]
MPDISWQNPLCGDEGGNSCLQIGHTSTGTLILRETTHPTELITTTRQGLRNLIEAAKRGDLDHLL